jgi:hypothetical protein
MAIAELTPDQINDLVEGTLPDIVKKGGYTNLQTDITEFVGMSNLYDKHIKTFHGGMPWRLDAQVDQNHSAKWTALYGEDSAAGGDTMEKIEIRPRFLTANITWDVKEPMFQQGSSAIYDLLETRSTARDVSIAEKLEYSIFSGAQDSSDKLTMYGLDYWLQRSSSAGFNGGNPAGFPEGCGGLSTVKVPRWANYTDTYSAISKVDLVKAMRTAFVKTGFKSITKNAVPTVGKGKGIYTTTDVLLEFEDILDAGNMNLGNDLTNDDGVVLFKGREVVAVPMLDTDTTAPIMMIDWSTMAFGIQAGWKKKMSKPTQVANKHTVFQIHTDMVVNLACTDRRKNTIIYKV